METEHIVDLSDRLYYVTLAFIGLLVVAALGYLIYQFHWLPQNAPHDISVSGQGKAYAKPDVALVTLGVHTEAQTSQDAVNQNNTIMNKVIAAVKQQGVSDQDIQTTLYNLTPIYDTPVVMPAMPPTLQKSTFNGYELDQQVEVKIRDFSKINNILDQATANGANTVGELQFNVDNIEKVKDEARAQAIAQAKTEAASIFKEAGLSMGKLVNISEDQNFPMPLYNAASGAAAVSSSVAPQIQTGQMEVDSTITLTYQIN